MSNSYGDDYEEMYAQLTLEQKKVFRNKRLERERAKALGYTFGGVAESFEQEAFDEIMRRRESGGTSASDSQTASSQDLNEEDCNGNKGDVQYRSANIHNSKDGRFEEVTVIEDTACPVNFISPSLAKRCSLAIMATPPIKNETWLGPFISNQGAFVTWVGKSGKLGSDLFYIAPETAPSDVQMVVGTQFMNDHPSAFKERRLLEPALLTVGAKMKTDEKSQLEAREALANSQAAELERRRKQAKQKGGEKPTGSSSRTSRSSKK